MPKKRRKMKKAQSERWHFKYAIKERYGLYCNSTMYYQLRKYVDPYNFEYLLKQSHTRYVLKLSVPWAIFDERSIPKVPVENDMIKVYVVYDSLRHEFCTALPWYATDEELLKELQGEYLYVRA